LKNVNVTAEHIHTKHKYAHLTHLLVLQAAIASVEFEIINVTQNHIYIYKDSHVSQMRVLPATKAGEEIAKRKFGSRAYSYYKNMPIYTTHLRVLQAAIANSEIQIVNVTQGSHLCNEIYIHRTPANAPSDYRRCGNSKTKMPPQNTFMLNKKYPHVTHLRVFQADVASAKFDISNITQGSHLRIEIHTWHTCGCSQRLSPV